MLLMTGWTNTTRGRPNITRRPPRTSRSALAEDPKYSQAALYLARTYNLLFEMDKAKHYFQKAIEIDPDYLEARSTYGGMLLDLGDLDESIRQLNAVVRRDAKNSLAWGLLAQALCRKDSFVESIDAARKAIKLNPSNAEVHLWLAESLRRSNAVQRIDPGVRCVSQTERLRQQAGGKSELLRARVHRRDGTKKRANLKDVWKELRSLAYFGSLRQRTADHEIRFRDPALPAGAGYDPGDPTSTTRLRWRSGRKASRTAW